jgi:hypothetical protein
LQHENKHRKKVASLLKKKQRRLANLINLTLSNQGDELRYYQGYHDVACIFLHALGNDGGDKDPLGVELPARVLGQVTQFQLRDSCRSSFDSFQQCLQWTLFPLLAKLDPVLHNHLQDCDMEPFFCLSWILTWFAHDVRDTNLVKRLFDAFLVSHPLLVLYVSIAMMTHPINRQILLDTDCDFAALHHTLSMLPRNSSRAGWKKGRQGGYISDDVNEEDAENESDDDEEEEADDNQTTHTGMDSRWDHSVASTSEHYLQDHKSMSLATSTTTGLTLTPNSSVNHMPQQGTSQRNDRELVPFQLLIETALGFMNHYPPSGLMELARWYYQHQHIANVSPTSSNIRMLQAPPSWAIASTATADWVYKQRARQEMGRTKTSRKDRRRKRKLTIQQQEQQALVVAVSAKTHHQLSDEEFLQLHRRTMAVIAAGYGPFGAKEEAMYLRRKRRMMRGALLVGVTAVMMGAAYQYFYNTDYLVGNIKMQDDNPQIYAWTDESCKATTDASRTEESLLEKRVHESGSQAAVAQKKEPPAEAPAVTSDAASGLSTRASAAVQRDEAPQISAMPVGPSSTPLMTASSSKASLDSTRPVLPPSITPAKLFPSPSRTRPDATTQPETPKQTRLFPFKLDEQLKKVTLALYRYLYYWTSKLIMRPIQLVKHFWQQLPRSPPASNNLHE